MATVNLVVALHQKVAEAAQKTIAETKNRGIIVAVHSGLRTAEEQEKLYAKGRTIVNPDGKSAARPMGNIITNARAYESWHSFGLAVDIVFKTDKGGWTWAKTPEEWGKLGAVGESFGLEWGGRWKKFPDVPHFQMRGKIKSVAEAKKILLERGVDALWALV